MDNLIINHLRDRLKFIQTQVTPDSYNLLIEEVMQFSQEAVNGCAAALEEFYTKIKGNEQYNLGYKEGYKDKQHGKESAI